MIQGGLKMYSGDLSATQYLRELRGLNIDKLLYEVRKELNISDIQITINDEQIESLINDSVDVDVEELGSKEISKRGIRVIKDGTGKFYSITNINLHLVDFVEGAFSLITADEKYTVFAIAFFVLKFFSQICVDLNEEQIAIIIVLYQETKHCMVTDENVEDIIFNGLKEGGYDELRKEEIKEQVRSLVKLKIIEIKEGSYFMVQKIRFF